MNEFNYDLAPAGKRMAVLMPGDEKDAWAGYRVNATRLPAFIPSAIKELEWKCKMQTVFGVARLALLLRSSQFPRELPPQSPAAASFRSPAEERGYDAVR